MTELGYWNRLSIEDLLWTVEEIAKERYDGHYSVMRFTTHWKGMFGTPNLDSNKGRVQIQGLQEFPSLKKTLVGMLMSQRILILSDKVDRYWGNRVNEIIEEHRR